jgi:hypothetical protein
MFLHLGHWQSRNSHLSVVIWQWDIIYTSWTLQFIHLPHPCSALSHIDLSTRLLNKSWDVWQTSNVQDKSSVLLLLLFYGNSCSFWRAYWYHKLSWFISKCELSRMQLLDFHALLLSFQWVFPWKCRRL